jgi:SAM-dependent methyltransferase
LGSSETGDGGAPSPEEQRKARLRREFERHGLRRPAVRGLELIEAGLGYRAYQPLYGVEDDPDAPGWTTTRGTDERWAMMEPHLPSTGSALDIGSQHGWFTFKLAERGLFAIGVDHAERSVRISQSLAMYNGAGRATFLHAKVDPETARFLPTVDVVLFMSVFHHLVRRGGLEEAELCTKRLAERCRHQMVFDTGGPDHPKKKWGEKLAFMGSSPRDWVGEFLLSVGFSDVTHIGDSIAHPAESPRALMLATK